MGAGEVCGAGDLGALAGLDPQLPALVLPTPAYPTALAFDPSVRQYVQNADGTMESLDPVDAAVALALGIEFGKLPSAATFGQKLRTILNRVSPARQQNIATQEVLRVLGTLISNGDITLRSVTVQTAGSLGQTSVTVNYTNLRTARPNPNGFLTF
jgi:hypothetical protein